MSKLLVKVVCFILCISLLSGLAIAQPITNNTHVEVFHEDSSYLNRQEMLQLKEVLFSYKEKQESEVIKEEIEKILPNAIVIDVNEANEIRDLADLMDVLNSNNMNIKNVENLEEQLLKLYEGIKLFFDENLNSEGLLIIEFDEEQQSFSMTGALFCIFCATYVIVNLLMISQGESVKWVNGFGWALVFTSIHRTLCTVCLGIVSERVYEEYIEPVPTCGFCQQLFTRVNYNWYCPTCNVWL